MIFETNPFKFELVIGTPCQKMGLKSSDQARRQEGYLNTFSWIEKMDEKGSGEEQGARSQVGNHRTRCEVNSWLKILIGKGFACSSLYECC